MSATTTPHVVQIHEYYSIPTRYGWECDNGRWDFVSKLFFADDAKADHNKHCPAPLSTITWKVIVDTPDFD